MFEQWRGHSQTRAIQKAPERRGQSFVEYVLIILFVALAVVAALTLLAPQIAGIFDTINSGL